MYVVTGVESGDIGSVSTRSDTTVATDKRVAPDRDYRISIKVELIKF